MMGEEELRRILASRCFAHSFRLRDLLVNLFRGQNPRDEPQGRVDLARLRRRLAIYYAEEGCAETSRFVIDSGKLTQQTAEGTPAAPQAIAVLPVLNSKPEWAFLSDGLTEELINSLALIKGVRVLGRQSVFQYRGANRDLKTIAKVLNAGYLLESSLRIDGNNLRVVAQLSDAAGGGWLMWAEEFKCPLNEVLSVRDGILAAVTDALRIEEQVQGLYFSGAHDSEAFLEYLRGRWMLAQRKPETLRESVARFRAACGLDDQYAQPYVGMAESWVMHAVNDLASAMEVMPQAKSAARKALELHPESAEPLVLLGAVHSIFDWRWSDGEADITEGIARKPGAIVGHYALGFLNYGPQARWRDAEEQMQRVLDLDPISNAAHRDLGQLQYFKRDYDTAMQELRRARDHTGSDYWLARLYIELRRWDEALDTLAVGGAATHRNLSAAAYTYARMGRRSQAEQVLKQLRDLSRSTRVSPLDFSIPLIGMSRFDEAFAYLRQALAERTTALAWFLVDPVYDPIRRDPRAQAILATLNLN